LAATGRKAAPAATIFPKTSRRASEFTAVETRALLACNEKKKKQCKKGWRSQRKIIYLKSASISIQSVDARRKF
jgi:hypothetical protein